MLLLLDLMTVIIIYQYNCITNMGNQHIVFTIYQMDINIFTELLRNLDLKNESILGTMQYCWNNKSSAVDIVRMIEKEMLSSKKQKKLCFLYLLHELLVNSQKFNEIDYIKQIGSKIKGLLTDFVKSVDNYQEASNVNKLVDRWNNQQIFASSFIDKLKEVLMPVCRRLLELSENKKIEKQTNMRYSKTFMLDYLAVKEFEPTRNIYEDFVVWNELENKLTRFNQEYSKLDQANPSTDNVARSSELLRVAEEYKHSLIKLIESYHEDYRQLSAECVNELERHKELQK